MGSAISNSLETAFVFVVGFSMFWVPAVFVTYAACKRKFTLRFLLLFIAAEFLSWRLSAWVLRWAFSN